MYQTKLGFVSVEANLMKPSGSMTACKRPKQVELWLTLCHFPEMLIYIYRHHQLQRKQTRLKTDHISSNSNY